MIKISIFLISLLLFIGTVRLIYNQPPAKIAADPIPTFPTVLGQETQKTCQPEIALNTLIDKFHGLPENYIPPDLIPVGNFKLRAEAATQLSKMLTTMGENNLFVPLDSAYRSYDDQKQLFHPGDMISAQPGYSEHQLGTAVDLNLKYPSTQWTWLDKNAQKFGFVMSYRANQTTGSGYAFEPWHWRYVGIDLATKIRYSKNLPQSFYSPLDRC